MSGPLSNSVFISYRRSANPYLALAVYQDLHGNGIERQRPVRCRMNGARG